MKVLFIGGTGIISSACAPAALAQGIDLYLLNRSLSSRPAPEGARLIQADIRDREAARQALAGQDFDVVVDWIAFTPDHVEADLDLFRGRTGQYIFISSASAYQSPPANLPVTESTVLANPFWQYSRNKIACEDRLVRAYREEAFPVTIVRPSHTYDPSLSPLHGGYTTLNRLIRGRPVIIHGDGTSLWTLTHHRDFARGFTGLLGNSRAIGEAVHITSDEWLTWNDIAGLLGRAAGVTPRLVHLPSEVIAAYDPDWGASLLGDKAHSMIFDNSKIRRLAPGFHCEIPFSRGAAEIIAWYAADPSRQKIDPELDRRMDALVSVWERLWPER